MKITFVSPTAYFVMIMKTEKHTADISFESKLRNAPKVVPTVIARLASQNAAFRVFVSLDVSSAESIACCRKAQSIPTGKQKTLSYQVEANPHL